MKIDMEFICGCRHSIDNADSKDIGWWKETSTDRDGFLICTTHRARRKNWNSLPQGVSKQLACWRFANWTPLQREQFFVFGVEPTPVVFEIDFDGEDRRDNSDPQLVGATVIGTRGAQTNGHSNP